MVEPPSHGAASYRTVWAEPRFRVLFLSRALAISADTLRVVALSIVIFTATGSPALAALTYGISFLPQLFGASLFGALADRVPPRRLIAAGYALECVTALVLAFAPLPVWASLALVAAVSCLTPLFLGAASRVMADVLVGDAYVLARSLSNAASSAAQLLGLVGGGLAVAALGGPRALAVSAACHLVASLWVRLRLPYLPAPPPEPATHRSTMGQSWHGNLRLLGDRPIRVLLLAQWLPAAFATGAESLIVPYAAERGFPTAAAGWLLAALPVGMIAGDLVVGRFVRPADRERLVPALVATLGVPLLVFTAGPPLISAWPPLLVAAGLLLATGFGFAYGLGVQRQFRELVPESVRGQAFGLMSTGLMTAQGITPALCGLAAELLPTGQVIALAGVATVATAVVLRGVLPGVFAAGVDRVRPASTPPVRRSRAPSGPR